MRWESELNFVYQGHCITFEGTASCTVIYVWIHIPMYTHGLSSFLNFFCIYSLMPENTRFLQQNFTSVVSHHEIWRARTLLNSKSFKKSIYCNSQCMFFIEFIICNQTSELKRISKYRRKIYNIGALLLSTNPLYRTREPLSHPCIGPYLWLTT